MSKISLIFLLGIIVAVLPSTGFPGAWKTIFYLLIGSAICILTLLARREINFLRRALKGKEHTVTDSFVQSGHIDTYGRTGKGASENPSKHIIN